MKVLVGAVIVKSSRILREPSFEALLGTHGQTLLSPHPLLLVITPGNCRLISLHRVIALYFPNLETPFSADFHPSWHGVGPSKKVLQVILTVLWSLPARLHLHPTRMSETLLDISSFYSDNLHIVLQFRYFNIWQIPVWTIFIYFEVPSTFNPVALLNCGYIWCFPWFLGGNKIMPCCIKIRRCCPSSIILLWLHNVGVVVCEADL